jgi:IS5 family transposase
MGQNYLYRESGIQINALLSCTAWNLKKLMEVLKEQAARLLRRFCIRLFFPAFSCSLSAFGYS